MTYRWHRPNSTITHEGDRYTTGDEVPEAVAAIYPLDVQPRYRAPVVLEDGGEDAIVLESPE